MSLAQRLANEAEKEGVDVELALQLLDHFKAKTAARGHVDVPDVVDPAQPTHNQALLCWRRYNQFLVCLNENDGDKSACKKIDYLTRATCPVAWLAEWKEQREEGTFPGVASPHLPDDDEE